MTFDAQGQANELQTGVATVARLLEAPAPKGRLHPVAEQALQASLRDRMAMIIKDCMIHYPSMDRVLTEAEWMVHEPRQTRARGLVVCAGRGNGKTCLANLIHRRFHAYDDPDQPCVVRTSISGIRDARSLYGRILEELGSPARISHRLSDRELLVQRLLRDVDCRLLILDEVQDVLLGSEREQQRALEGIKLLMNELRLPVIAFGTEKAGQGFSADPHLQARFTQLAMPAWKADNTLANFLAAYEQLLPLKAASKLASDDKVKFLAKVGEGVLEKIVTRVKNAALAAIVDGSEKITLAHLKDAVTRPAACGLRPSMDAT
ncbi:TniB family NTP-binding protein [Marilutibacter chinensis]|uniref:TniB family NTP-binding protein n=1 Tax=Marilutibacter chinensis TaxID=2912247 RepID=A0ABS9HTR2_9GAMM|nr:TniB family NTP-binding protein [Lysobacter chinensis]MCF7221599.1 TniB family NTP-binding protein [Lysobacter chinensis]